MAKKKAPWVGPKNPADPNTGVLTPRAEMDTEQRAEAEKVDPAKPVEPKPLPVEGKKVYKAPVQKRPKPKVATAAKLKAAGVRPAKNTELKKGIVAVTTAEKPKRKKAVRTTTKTGKKIDPKTGKIKTPKKGQIAKVGDKLVRVSDENIGEATQAAVTTQLPTAGPEVATPRVELPSAGRDAFQGFSTSNPEHHSALKEHLNNAWKHIGGMIRTRGTDEYHAHHEAFNATHATIANYHPSLGRILDVAYNAVHKQPDHPDSAKALTMAKQAAGDTIKAGLSAASGRAASQQKARAERMARIRAEREGN